MIASTDYIRAFADQIRQWVPRADLPGARHRRLRPQRLPRAAELLRGRPPPRHRRGAEVARRRGRDRAARVQEAIERYEIDPEAPIPDLRMTATARSTSRSPTSVTSPRSR